MEKNVRLPFDVLVHLLNMVTKEGKWDLREKLLLSSRALHDYSKTTQHLAHVVKSWHERGCWFLMAKIQRTMPITISNTDLQRALDLAKECTHQKRTTLYGHLNSYYSMCRVCNRTVFYCSVM